MLVSSSLGGGLRGKEKEKGKTREGKRMSDIGPVYASFRRKESTLNQNKLVLNITQKQSFKTNKLESQEEKKTLQQLTGGTLAKSPSPSSLA